MTMIRWSPVMTRSRDLIGIQDEVNRLLDGVFGRVPARDDGMVFTPTVDIDETPHEFILRADLPGVPLKDVKVSMMGDTLTIRGERKIESDRQQGTIHRIERAYGTFERSFTLVAPVRSDQVKATYRDGVLEVRVPKAEEARQKEIEIQAA